MTADGEKAEFERTLDAVWRIEAPKLIARLARTVRDVDLAEELAGDAFVAALVQWPVEGIPRNPGAWLMVTAKRRAVDRFRRDELRDRKHAEVARELTAATTADIAAELIDDDIGDDLLRLIFIACHPILSMEARVALTLRLLGGLTTAEIARAFLVAEPVVAQRIVRAKRTLSAAGIPFEVPGAEHRAARLSAVLEVIYLIFNEGYAASAGANVMRPELVNDALRLGRVLATLTPGEAEVHALVALMEITASRSNARVAPSGQPILLLEQDRGKWDHLLIGRGLAALERAQTLAHDGFGPYGLQAAIAACHARAHTASDTDWARIVALYDALAQRWPSPVVQLNRAVAIGMAYGPQPALDVVDALQAEPALRAYHLLPSVRGDLLEKLGRWSEAHAAYARASELAHNERDRALLLERAARCAHR